MPEYDVIVTFVFRITDAKNPVVANQEVMQYFIGDGPAPQPVEHNTRVVTLSGPKEMGKQ